MEDTWASRDLPVLDAAVRLLEDKFDVRVRDIAAETGFDVNTVAQALDALEGPYVVEVRKSLGPDPSSWYIMNVTAEARQAVGQSGPRRNPWSNAWPRPSARPPKRNRTRSGRAAFVRWPASSALPGGMWPRRSSPRSSCTRPGWAEGPPHADLADLRRGELAGH